MLDFIDKKAKKAASNMDICKLFRIFVRILSNSVFYEDVAYPSLRYNATTSNFNQIRP